MIEISLYVGIASLILWFVVLTYLAFRESWLWGLACLILSPLPFSIRYWKECIKVSALIPISIFCFALTYFLIPGPKDHEEQFAVQEMKAYLEEMRIHDGFSQLKEIYLGPLAGCGDLIDIDHSSNYENGESYRLWRGRFECYFSQTSVFVDVDFQYSKNGWQHVYTTVHTP